VVLDDEKPGELVQLTVKAPRAGTPEELASLQVQGLKGDEAIYYLDLAITNVSAAPTGGDYNPSTTSQLLALQPDQSPATPVIKFSTFDPCENELPADLAVGGSFQTCEIVVTSGGQPIEHVQFVATLTSDPIIWS
jgi:hypothetical protein